MTTSQRRYTKFSNNSISSVFDKRFAEQDLKSHRLSSSRISQVSNHFQVTSRSRSSALFLKMNLESSQFFAVSLFKKTHKICCDETSWKKYHSLFSILKNDEADKVVVIYRKEYRHNIVVIKKYVVTHVQSLKRLTTCSHENIVDFHDFYLDQNSLFISYEWMNVILAKIRSTLNDNMKSFHIATIYKEICDSSFFQFDSHSTQLLQDFEYIHEKLRIAHEFINTNHILLSRSD